MPRTRIVAVAAGAAPEFLPAAVAVPILAADADIDDSGAGRCALSGDEAAAVFGEAVYAEIVQWLEYEPHTGKAGHVVRLARPAGPPRLVLLVGVGAADETGWRAAGAALARAKIPETSLTIAMNEQLISGAVGGLATGLWLARYRYRLADPKPSTRPELAEVRVIVTNAEAAAAELEAANAITDATAFARDLTNAPSNIKNPIWFAAQVTERAQAVPGLSVRVRDEAELATSGFGGIVAVGAGSAEPPRLVELSWQPASADSHVVLVGKGITFDTGGISIKPADAMLLMRKDMGGAAAVVGATLAAAALRLPIRVTTLAPLAENAFSGAAMRPGDVITHFDGQTSEVTNTDAEGRLVLADALAYAAAELEPDYLIDLATLTGANLLSLGRRHAALYSEDDDLARALADAAAAAGERAWRMPLYDDYLADFASDVADRTNSALRGAGSVTAALFLREFTGTARDRWAHFDMSAPSWSEKADGELVKGATGWGVRTLVRWLQSLAAGPDRAAHTDSN
jgi:leucyl aminopeptidase